MITASARFLTLFKDDMMDWVNGLLPDFYPDQDVDISRCQQCNLCKKGPSGPFFFSSPINLFYCDDRCILPFVSYFSATLITCLGAS